LSPGVEIGITFTFAGRHLPIDFAEAALAHLSDANPTCLALVVVEYDENLAHGLYRFVLGDVVMCQ
jgi:hypothetical protein